MFGPSDQSPDYGSGFVSYDKKRLEEMINEYDKNMLQLVGNLYSAVNKEKLDLTKIGNAVEALSKYNEKSEYNYLNNLLNPERCKGVKIPSPIPVPSCSFQLHNCVTLAPDGNSGNLGVVFNPFFLVNNTWYPGKHSYQGIPQPDFVFDQNGTKYDFDSTDVLPKGTRLYAPDMLTSLFICNTSITGTSANSDGYWRPININQSIPPVYDQYRLVSASVVVKYIGRLDIVSGVIGGAIIFDENPYLGGNFYKGTCDGTEEVNACVQRMNSTDVVVPPGIGKYANFDLAMDSFYHQENMMLEGIRQLYFPIDNSYEEYSKLLGPSAIENISNEFKLEINTDDLKSGFNFFIYTMGAPSGACLKLDIYCNYECLPNAAFLNYMPISVSNYGMSNQEKKDAIKVVQEKPIMKADETIVVKSPQSMGWKGYMNDMAKRFKSALPGIGKLVSMGLEYLVPQLKPAITVAGSIISSLNNQVPKQETPITPTETSMNIETPK